MPDRPRRTPADRLIAAVHALAGPHAALLSTHAEPWASVTFTGTRHTLALAFAGDTGIQAGEAFIAALPDHEFAIPRHLVAEATIAAVDHAVLPAPRIEIVAVILLLEDA